jgi:transcriptional antiterminator NusG
MEHWEGLFCLKIMEQSFCFCLFCETSKESNVETFLKRLGLDVISALVERNIFKNGKWIKESRSIIPGYVFFENNHEPNWNEIRENKHIYYPLEYLDKSKNLRENDLQFVKWLKKHNGTVNISKAIEIGNKIKILEGPLKELEGKIVKIKKRQKCACVEIDGEGIKNQIWLSYEIIG